MTSLTRTLLTLAVVFALSSPRALNAQSGSTAPAPQVAQGVTEFTVNGLKVLVKRRPTSQTVALGLFIKGGSRNITAQNAGIEAVTLDLATEATTNFPREVLRRELARTASALSYGVNHDFSVLTLGTTRQYFDRTWDVFVDAVLHPRLGPEDFDLVKQRRLSSLSDDEDGPDSMLSVMGDGVAYAGHPYSRQPGGTTASITRLTLDDVRKYQAQLMETSRLLLVIVGDLDATEVQRKVTAAFSKLPVGTFDATPPPALSFAAPTISITTRALPTNYISGIYAAPSLTSEDIYPMRVATSILRNRVFEEVRVKRSLSYAPDVFLNEQATNTGGIYVTAVDANQAVQVMLHEISVLQNEDLEPDELTGTAQSFLTSHYLDQETNAAQAGELARYELIGGGWRNSAVLLDKLRLVTPRDVRRVASKYMTNLQFVVIGDPSKIDRRIFTRQPGR